MADNLPGSSTLPITGLPYGGVFPLVIVCGDQDRAGRISSLLDSKKELSRRREYHAYNGEFNGIALTVCSHGVGAPGAAIVFEELVAAGARIIIRVGTCGGMQESIHDGDLVIATAAVQNTGYGCENFPPGYPASADYKVIQALVQAAGELGFPARTGLVLTRDVFYVSKSAPAHTPDYLQLSRAGVLAVEMECAALFQIGNLHGVCTGAVLAVDGNVLESAESFNTYSPDRQVVHKAVEQAIQTGLNSLRFLKDE